MSTAVPSQDVSGTTVPANHELVVEGQAKMIYPKIENTVFYNPVQVQNRDLSILMISLYAERRAKRIAIKSKKKDILRNGNQEKALAEQLDAFSKSTDWSHVAKRDAKTSGLSILDALAASGLRSIRYWKEIAGVRKVVINDMDPAAVDQARDNIAFNNLSDVMIKDQNDSSVAKTSYGIRLSCGDATHLMYMSRRPPNLFQHTNTQKAQHDQFDVIDLDPYGSAAPFLDAALQSVVSGGMLCVTCTDMAALGGSHPETCYGRYGAMPIPRARYLQELALRILLQCMSTTAARYGRTIKPILSVGMAFYVRVFVEINDDKAGVNKASLNIGTVYQSTQCPSFHTVRHGLFGHKNKNIYQPSRAPLIPACEETGGQFKVAGPIWLGPLHDFDIVDEAISRLEKTDGTEFPLQTKTRLHGLLTAVSEELSDVPLYYTLPDLCHALHCESPPLNKMKAALVNAGYRVSAYHKEPQAIKTDAPNRIVWDVMRAWCKDHPVKGSKKKKRRKKNDSDSSELKEDDSQSKSVSSKILDVEPSIMVDFTIPKSFENRKKAQRYPMNPEENWGPKKAASGYKRKRTTEAEEASQGEEPSSEPEEIKQKD